MQTILSGSLAYDRIMEFPEHFHTHLLPEKLQEINVCFMVDGVTENFGGTAGNIGYALKLMGGSPEISATIGQDKYRYIEWLKENDISLDRLHNVESELTAGAYITTDKGSNQITNFNPGAMKYSSNLDFSTLDNDALMIVSPGNLDDMIQYPALCRANAIKYIFDPGQALPMLQPKDLLQCIDDCYLLMVNDYEMNLILNKTECSREEILERSGNTIITFGEKGSILYEGSHQSTIPVYPAKQVLDPTGAGDAYRGGLLKGLVDAKPLEESCHLGSICSSFAVEHNGTQVYRFSKEEFEARRKEL